MHSANSGVGNNFVLMHAGDVATMPPSSGLSSAVRSSPPRKKNRLDDDDPDFVPGDQVEEDEDLAYGSMFDSDAWPHPPTPLPSSSNRVPVLPWVPQDHSAADRETRDNLQGLMELIRQQSQSQLVLQEAARQLAETTQRLSFSGAQAGFPQVASEAKREFKYKLSSGLSSKLTSAGAEVRKKLHKVTLERAQLLKCQEQMKKLAAGQILAQLKPFKIPFEAEEWGSKVNQADLSAMIVSAGREEVLSDIAERLHVEYLASSIMLNELVHQKKLARLREEASEPKFIEHCLSIAAKERDTILKNLDTATIRANFWNDFELDVKYTASKIYLEQVSKIAGLQVSEEERKESQKKKSDLALKKAGELPAEEVLRRGLSEILNKKPKSRTETRTLTKSTSQSWSRLRPGTRTRQR